MTNTELVERYPFLALRNAWTADIIEDYDPERDGTYLDEMPRGWKIAFGEQMCEELRNELLRWDYLDDYRILQVKEKYGTLHWYDNGIPSGIWSEQYLEIPIADWQFVEWYEEEQKWPRNEFYKEYVYDNDKNIIAVHIHRYLDRCKVYDIIEKYEDISGYRPQQNAKSTDRTESLRQRFLAVGFALGAMTILVILRTGILMNITLKIKNENLTLSQIFVIIFIES